LTLTGGDRVQLTQRLWKGINGTLAYTYGKAIDTASEARSVAPANSYNLRLDRGPSDFDTRHILTAFVSYNVPSFTQHWKPLTQGWQINALTADARYRSWAHRDGSQHLRAASPAGSDKRSSDAVPAERAAGARGSARLPGNGSGWSLDNTF